MILRAYGAATSGYRENRHSSGDPTPSKGTDQMPFAVLRYGHGRLLAAPMRINPDNWATQGVFAFTFKPWALHWPSLFTAASLATGNAHA